MGQPDRRAPAKLARGLMARGMTRGETARYFREQYQVSAARTALAMRAAAHAQAAISLLPEDEVSLYIGIPFCPSRCAYCSFVSHSIEKSARSSRRIWRRCAGSWRRPGGCWTKTA